MHLQFLDKWYIEAFEDSTETKQFEKVIDSALNALVEVSIAIICPNVYQTDVERAERIVEIVESSDGKPFNKFVEALAKTNQPTGILDLLKTPDTNLNVAEEEAARRAKRLEEEKRKATEEEAARRAKRLEEEKRKATEEEAARRAKQLEEEKRKAAEEEAARRAKQLEEEKRKATEEEAARRAKQLEEEKRKAAEEEAARRAKQLEDEKRKAAEQEAARRAKHHSRTTSDSCKFVYIVIYTVLSSHIPIIARAGFHAHMLTRGCPSYPILAVSFFYK